MTMADVTVITQCVSSFWLFLVAFHIHLKDSEGSSAAEVERHIQMGKDLLARGQLQDALSHLHAAIEGDPNNYMSFYRRATAFLALGRSKAALRDLERVIELKSDFVAARLQRGNVLLKQGRLDEAHIDYEKVLRKEPGNVDANRNYLMLDPLKERIRSARMHYVSRDYASAIAIITSILETCPWDVQLRELRADCLLAVGDAVGAMSDLRATTKLVPDNTDGHLRLSKLHYDMGEAEESLNTVRECLRIDPDHKDCFAHYKLVKKVAKALEAAQTSMNNQEYQACVDSSAKVLKLENRVQMVMFRAHDRMCHCNMKLGEYSSAIKACDQALKINKEPRIFCDRADAHLNEDEFDQAIHDYQRAMELEEGFQRAREGVQKAQKLQKQSKRRDYYKILGLKKTASKRDVMKAYRKAAQKWHPDNFVDAVEKKKAEKMFMDIAAAKEVLADPEKRQRFDNGDDPLDPESEQGRHFNPFEGFQHFHHGGFPGGGPFQFKFHFN